MARLKSCPSTIGLGLTRLKPIFSQTVVLSPDRGLNSGRLRGRVGWSADSAEIFFTEGTSGSTSAIVIALISSRKIASSNQAKENFHFEEAP